MTRARSEDWQQVKKLFDAALEHQGEERARFLDHACADDPALRHEVESLLHADENASSFMESPAVEVIAEDLAGTQVRLAPGQRIGHYDVTAQIAEGGMGEVYLAKDTKLGRLVAIKLLPEYLTGDADRLRRFKQEARTASALNHPNVCVIHEIGESDTGRPFIAMEYVDGVTLRQRLNERALTIGESLDIGIQVADALSAAHQAGIVHRDIKPENVMIRRDGYVKVLDFGLAKLTERQRLDVRASSSTLLMNSTPGMIMGTVGYMSPEQARGVAIDHRTDVFSLGVLLYEMISGRAPFEGTTPTDIVIAIVERDQGAISQTAGAVPPELERIVRKALRKQPDERYQLVREMAIDLRSLRKDLELDSQLDRTVSSRSGSRSLSTVNGDGKPASTKDFTLETTQTRATESVAPTSRFSWLTRLGLAAIVLGVLAGSFVLFKMWDRNSRVSAPAPFQKISFTKLTTNGNAIIAALSPDGKYLAYVLSEGGKQALWLRQVAINSNVQLVAPREGRYLGAAFSPDGDFVYYGYAASDINDSGAAYRIPVLGIGNAATTLEMDRGPMAVSHDRKRVAFILYDRKNELDILTIANPDGSGEQAIAQRKWPERFSNSWETKPAWTTNDEALTIPLLNSDANGLYFTIYEVRLADRSEKIIPLSPQRFSQPGGVSLLSDGSGIVMSAEAYGASFPQIWLLMRDGSARSITNDLSDYLGVSLRSDSGALATIQRQTLSKIWLLPKGDTTRATALTSGTSRYFDLSWAKDGKIVYASDASGNADIYEMAADGSNVRQLTANAKRNYGPAVSPDGRYIVFHSNRSGIFQIWRTDRDGANPKQLTFGNSESNWPVFSGDGKWVIYEHFESGVPGTIWKVSIEGGTPVKVTDGILIRPAVSPDGKSIAFWQNDGKPDSRWRLGMMPFDAKSPIRTFEVAPTVQVQWDTLLRWTPEGSGLIYVDHRNGIDNIWIQSIQGGQPRQLTTFTEGRIFSFDWSADRNLVTSRGVTTSDVVLISDLKQ